MGRKTEVIKQNVSASKKIMVAMFLMILVALNFSCNNTTTNSEHSNLKSIKVMSYNIHYGYGMDKIYDLPRIANIILNEKADIVGIQEISDSTMANELGRLTDMHVAFGPSIDGKM